MPEISEEQLKKINEALSKAVESEKLNKRFLETLGPAIVETMKPVIDTISDVIKTIPSEIKQAISQVKVTVPEIKSPHVEVPKIVMPEMKQPEIHVAAPIVNVPESIVNVTVPPIKVPKSDVKVSMPTKALTNEMRRVTEAIKAQPIPMFNTPDYTFKKPIPAIMVDAKGKPMDFGGGGSRVMSLTRFMDANNNPVTASANNPLPVVISTTLDVKQVSGANWSINVAQQDISLETKQVSGFADSVYVIGSADSMLSYQARTTNPTAVSDGADVRPSADKLGRGLNTPIQVRQLRATAFATLSTNTETSLLAGASGVFHDLVWVKFSNTSSAAVTVDLRDGTGGTIIDTWEVPANGVVGVNMSTPWPQSEAAATWTVDYNDSDLSNTTVYVSALFSKEL